ncbi:hypothetical protein MRX96_020725 [Rhipicephalus microplus]
MKLGAPYLRGTSPVYQSQCQGPLSAPEPRTSLLEAEGRSQQGPAYKCVQLSGRPSHSSFRASSFGKSLRHLTKARRPANPFSSTAGRTPGDVNAPPNRNLAPCFVWWIQKPAGTAATITAGKHTPRRAGRSSERAVPPIEYCASRPIHGRPLISASRRQRDPLPARTYRQPPSPEARRRFPRTAGRYALVHSGPVTSPVP